MLANESIEQAYKANLALCFTDTEGCSPGELYAALREVADRENAEAVLREKLNSNLRLKSEFSGMSGMELRRYVRRCGAIQLTVGLSFTL